MAVVFDALGTEATSNAVTTQSITGPNVGSGSAGSNRAVVVQFAWDQSGMPAGITVAYDPTGVNMAMTAIVGALATSISPFMTVAMFGLVGAIPSGAKTITATWTGTRDVCMQAISFTGVDQTGGATSFPNGNSNSGNGVPGTVTITSAIGNYVTATHALYGSISSTNFTQSFIDNGPNNLSGAGNYAAGASTVAMGISGSTAVWVSAGHDILAAGGGGGTIDTVGSAIFRTYRQPWRWRRTPQSPQRLLMQRGRRTPQQWQMRRGQMPRKRHWISQSKVA